MGTSESKPLRGWVLGAAVTGALAGIAGTATAREVVGGGDCQKNMCNHQAGNCTLVQWNYDCWETGGGPPYTGCDDDPCPN